MIEVSHQGRTALITLSRPDKHNALNIELCQRIRDAVRRLLGQRRLRRRPPARAEKRAPVFEGR